MGNVWRWADSGVQVYWTWAGAIHFDRFVVQESDPAMGWQDIGTVTNPAATEWHGPFMPGGLIQPYRVVVHLTTGESATSGEGVIVQT